MSERTADVSGPAQAAGKRHTDQPKSDDHPQRFGRAVEENLADTVQPGDSKDVRDTKIGALFDLAAHIPVLGCLSYGADSGYEVKTNSWQTPQVDIKFAPCLARHLFELDLADVMGRNFLQAGLVQ